VPVRRASEYPADPLVLRVTCAEEVDLVDAVAPERIAWIETTVALAAEEWPSETGLDVVLTDPARDTPLLYDVARLQHERPLRLTIECGPGVATAARIAMALQLPVRLQVQQPTEATIAELPAVLEGYLHDPRVTAPVEFFHSAIGRRLHGTPLTLWTAFERDPALHRRVADDGGPDPQAPPHDDRFVAAHLARLIADGVECARCRFQDLCAGHFKWPDASYECAPVVALLGRVEEAASALERDLADAAEIAR
jgi:hypothetical protein